MGRTVTEKEFCHERLGDKFQKAISSYDTTRRRQVLIDDFLSDDMLDGKSILDVGCGLGHFSERLAQRRANVTACDIGPTLVERTMRRVGCDGKVADVLELATHFGKDRFDGIVSSECIEHTPDPEEAIRQMLQVVKAGGFLSISTPNIVWTPVVKAATALGLRPFDGWENFSSWRSLRQTVESCHATVLREFGLHLFPFQLPLHGLSTWCDRRLQRLRGMMINCCILAEKCR